MPDPRPEIAEKVKILDAMTPGEKHMALKFLIGCAPAAFDQAVETIRWLREGDLDCLFAADSPKED